MNAPLLPEVLIGAQPVDQPALPLATEGVQRYVWQSAFGPILIEARDGVAFVNGQRVMSIDEMRGSSLVVSGWRFHLEVHQMTEDDGVHLNHEVDTYALQGDATSAP